MEIAELQKMKQEELHDLLREKRNSVQELRFKISLDEHKQVRMVRSLKKDIARILTVLNNARRTAIKPE